MPLMSDRLLFADWLKRRRKSLDLTRDELAQRAHCSASAIRRLEAGDLRASKTLAESLAGALEIPTEQHDAFVKFARGDTSTFLPPTANLHPIPNFPSPISNLPAPLTSLVGRADDIDAVCDLLREPGVRLLTLSGPPGTGKTRLGIAIAEKLAPEFSDGVHFVALAPITDATLVASAIAQTLGVPETGKNEIVAALREFLRAKNLLLVLDNFEQVVAAAPLITDLLTAAPRVKALVTSREVLRVYGEHEFPVPPLALADAHHLPTNQAVSFFARHAAIQLFKERARAVKANFQLTPENVADVARICAWLDGLPLAIEMAAAQTKWLTPAQLLTQLSERLALFTDGPRDLSPRQQSLAGAMDWSYDLLDDETRRAFEMLGVFVGGAREDLILDLAFEIGIANPKMQLAQLVEKSLLRYDVVAGKARLTMLETIRDYARAKLVARGTWDAIRQLHAEHFYRFALAARPHLAGGNAQAAWLDDLEAEHNNLRAALAWANEENSRADFALSLVDALYQFWLTRGYLSEAQRWMQHALAMSDSPSELRARVLNYVGRLAQMTGDLAQATRWQQDALAIQEQLGDEPGKCRTLETLAIIAGSQGNYTRAGALMTRALDTRRALGDKPSLLPPLNNLALISMRLGDLDRAEQLYHECADLSRELDAQKPLSHALHGLGEICVERNDLVAARALFRESVAIRYQLNTRTDLLNSLGALGVVLGRLGEADTATQLISAGEKMRADLGMSVTPANRAQVDEEIARLRGQLGDAAFERAWIRGRELSLAEMFALANSD